LYTYNLHGTTVFIADVARDTLRALEILKNRELTLIGPPASFGQYGTRNIFFGSLTLYAGAMGLAVGGLDPVATNLVSIALFLVAIPCVYMLFKELRFSEKEAAFGAILFAVSPLTVTHARFFWNANFLIPLSVFFWLAVMKRKPLIAGLLMGCMINVHYVSLYLLLGYAGWAMYMRRQREVVLFLLGTAITTLPLLTFELRNEWYLTQAVLFNLQHGAGGRGLTQVVIAAMKLPLTFFGLVPAEITFPSLLPAQLGGHSVRYFFPIYPLLIVGVLWVVRRLKLASIMPAVLIVVTMISLKVLWYTPVSSGAYVPLRTIERTAQIIVADNPEAPYNISENIIGDARGISFRYFLLRDARVQPESVEKYDDLQALYVISPSEDKIYKENRWEFQATKNLKLVREVPVDSVNVYVFRQASSEAGPR
jgi:hypothetical protein